MTMVIAVVGSANTDLHLTMPTLPTPGQTVLVSEAHQSPGGKGANQAVAAASSRGNVHFVAAVGNDDNGARMLRDLRGRQVNVEHVTTVSAPSGQAIVAVDSHGENQILVIPGANALLSPEYVTSALEQLNPAVLLCQLESPVDTIHAAFLACRNATRLLNPAPAQGDIASLRAVLEDVDILIPNRSELGFLAETVEPTTMDDVDAAVAKLKFAGDIVVTLGADGARIYPRESDGPGITMPPIEANVVDTTGAGDAFCGAFAVALAAGQSLQEATQNAVAYASASTEYHGAQPPVPAKYGPHAA